MGRPLTDEEKLKHKATLARYAKYERFKCGNCETLHDDEHDAEQCCPPDITEVYVCPDCEEQYGGIEEAEECEASHRTEEEFRPSAAELEALGQMPLLCVEVQV